MALASGCTATAAAEQFGICRKTVHRLLAKPAFRRMIAKIRDQMMAAAVGRMADHMALAADALIHLLESADAAVRLRAARAILGLGLRLHDAIDVTQRLRALEDDLGRRERGSDDSTV